jgi:hypothetical protein
MNDNANRCAKHRLPEDMKKTPAHRILRFLAILATMAPFSLAFSAQPADNKPKPPPASAPAIPQKPGFVTSPANKAPAKPFIAAPLLVSVTAVTEKPAASPTVAAAGANWQCAANQCSRSAPATFVTAESCRALAQQVGRIRSFGTATSQLDAAQLAQCNQGVVSIATAVRTEIPRIAPGSSGGPINVETNFIAKSKTGAAIPGAAAPSTDVAPIAIETNYIARSKTGNPVPSTSATSSAAEIAIETNYIARTKTGNVPAGAGATSSAGATPIDIQVNYIARPKSR